MLSSAASAHTPPPPPPGENYITRIFLLASLSRASRRIIGNSIRRRKFFTPDKVEIPFSLVRASLSLYPPLSFFRSRGRTFLLSFSSAEARSNSGQIKMNGPLAIFREPPALFLPANFSILPPSRPSRARAFGRHRCPNHSSSRRYFSSLLSHPTPACLRSLSLSPPLRRGIAEGPRMGNEGVIDGIRVTQSTDPTTSISTTAATSDLPPQPTLRGGAGPVNRQSLN